MVFVWQKPYCKICRKKNVTLSNQGYCVDCAMEKVKRVNRQIKQGTGFYANKRFAGYKRMIKRRGV